MIAVVSDTHGETDHRLRGRTLEAVRAADLVIHAGDFTTGAVVDSFRGESARFVAVHGNSDTAAVRERLPARRTVDAEDLRIVVVHGHEHAGTALSLLGRQEGADLVVFGHTHRPEVSRAGNVVLLNPGSHADPRWNRPAHAELERAGGGVRGRLCQPDETVLTEFHIE